MKASHALLVVGFAAEVTGSLQSAQPISEQSENDATSVAVSLHWYGESQCPNCQSFVTEHLYPEILEDSSISALLDYKFVPFGNTYFKISVCDRGGGTSYDVKERMCWQKKCLDPTTHTTQNLLRKDASCFTGKAVYQHSAKEGVMDIYETCAIKDAKVDDRAFVKCVETNFYEKEAADDLMSYCCDKQGDTCGSTEKAALQSCAATNGVAYEVENAKATPQHPGVPWVLIDGKPVDDWSKVKDEVCAALKSKGQNPSGCAAMALQEGTGVFGEWVGLHE